LRIAIVADIHGNRTAFEAVLSDLEQTAPDLIFHGGDLADGGSSPAEVVDRIRDLGWAGIVGNTDEMLFRPESLAEFARLSPALEPMLPVIEEMAAATRALLGEERLAWLRRLPTAQRHGSQRHGSMMLIHASPGDLWRAPLPNATDAQLESVYATLDQPICIYAHIHQPYIRRLSRRIVANTGSVGLSYDGDARASYLLLEDAVPSIRWVTYDLSRELQALAASGLPHADWVARTLQSAHPQIP
jgi:predicted phosphodiesterase